MIIPPIFKSVASTIGENALPINLVKGAAIKMLPNKSRSAGAFFSINFTTNAMRYPAKNPGSKPSPEHTTPIIRAYTGDTPNAKATSAAAATPPIPPAAFPTSPRNEIPSKSPPTYD